jgi:hypothetical protein
LPKVSGALMRRRPRGGGRGGSRGGVGLAQVVQDLHAALEVGRAGLGQRQAPGGAVQQPRAQAGFQLQHLAREHGLGGLLALGGLDIAARAHHGDEGFNLAQGVHGGRDLGLG